MSIQATQAATRSEERAVPPIAIGPHAGEALWFLGFLVTVKCSAETTAEASRFWNTSQRVAPARPCMSIDSRTSGSTSWRES
jgi:hypothetical protein